MVVRIRALSAYALNRLLRFTKKSNQGIAALVKTRLDDVGLGKDRDKMPAELSGGMNKRAGLARAQVLDP
jgi:phospholipid/cholesterol/gamma-HCH transport system ATP-binding protein